MTDPYMFHQTPAECAKKLIETLPLQPTDRLYEPFRGEGAFYNNFPAANPKDWSEIRQDRDYTAYTQEYDWVITNPPFKLSVNNKHVNAFWYLLDYYTQRAKVGVAFLANDYCLATLTPKRIALLQERGWGITALTICCIKKWRGRYFFIVLQKSPGFVSAIQGTF